MFTRTQKEKWTLSRMCDAGGERINIVDTRVSIVRGDYSRRRRRASPCRVEQQRESPQRVVRFGKYTRSVGTGVIN